MGLHEWFEGRRKRLEPPTAAAPARKPPPPPPTLEQLVPALAAYSKECHQVMSSATGATVALKGMRVPEKTRRLFSVAVGYEVENRDDIAYFARTERGDRAAAELCSDSRAAATAALVCVARLPDTKARFCGQVHFSGRRDAARAELARRGVDPNSFEVAVTLHDGVFSY